MHYRGYDIMPIEDEDTGKIVGAFVEIDGCDHEFSSFSEVENYLDEMIDGTENQYDYYQEHRLRGWQLV
jgi:hypothetical protein